MNVHSGKFRNLTIREHRAIYDLENDEYTEIKDTD